MPILLSRSANVFAAATVSLSLLPAWGFACAFHGGLQAGLSASHPAAVDVAMAIEAAEQAGTLGKQSLAPPPASMVAYHRVIKQIEGWRDRLSVADTPVSTPAAFSLLLIESALWSRFTRNPSGIGLTIHTAGPEAGEPVVLTAAPVVRAILDGRLSPSEALNRGLVRVEAAIEEKLALFELLAPPRNVHP